MAEKLKKGKAVMNLTPKRLRALRIIQQRPGCCPAALTEVTDRREVAWGSGTWSGFDKTRGAQAATRWGHGYVKPLAEAGLVEIRWRMAGVSPYRILETCLHLTPLGQRVARSGEMLDADSAGPSELENKNA